MSSIYSLLESDHKTVKKLFKDLEGYKKEMDGKSSNDKVKKIFTEIKNELEAHSKAEEKEFYNAIAAHKEVHTLILECKEEHSMVDKLLKELDESVRQDEKWFAKLHELKEIVEHHVEEEEDKLFTKAKKILSKEDEKKIAEKFDESKQKLIHPSQKSKSSQSFQI